MLRELCSKTAREVIGSYIKNKGNQLFREPLKQTDHKPDKLSEQIDSQNTTLYLHIPFCEAPLCRFCPFCRGVYNPEVARTYVNDLRQELQLYQKILFTSVYIGGGTPALVFSELASLIEEFQLNRGSLSVETHPRDLTPENIELMKKTGITRISVGVQSFNETVLKKMGRVNGPNVRENIESAQAAFEVVNVDLIFNFPGQTVEQFTADIDQLIHMGVSQITCYPLMASPGSFEEFDDTNEITYYKAMLEKFNAAGYTALTPWCFVKDSEEEQGEYITNHGGGNEYLGVGLSAISYLGSKFYINTFDINYYHECIEAGESPVIGIGKLSKFTDLQYNLLISLFGMKINTDDFPQRSLEKAVVVAELKALEIAGLVTRAGNTFRLTPEGMFSLSSLMKEFYTGLNYFRGEQKKDRDGCVRHFYGQALQT